MNHPKNKMWGQQITVSYIPMEGSSRAVNNRRGSSAASCPRTMAFGALAAGGDQCHQRSTRRGAASLRPCSAGGRASRRRALRAGATAGKEEEAGRVSSPPPARKKRQLGFRRAPAGRREDAAQGKPRRRPLGGAYPHRSVAGDGHRCGKVERGRRGPHVPRAVAAVHVGRKSESERRKRERRGQEEEEGSSRGIYCSVRQSHF